MEIQVQQHIRLPGVDGRALTRLARRVACEALKVAGAPEHSETSVVFVGAEEIRELNCRYRDIDRPTDVLAFSMRDGEELALPQGQSAPAEPLGDVIVSLETAALQAKGNGNSLRREIAILLVHGCLHLVGFDHGVGRKRTMRMRKAEKTCLEALEQNLVI
jgi:probable rRNA maturation factor